MAMIIRDFVIETSTTTGTGNISLSGAVNSLRAFSSVCSTGDKVRVIIKAIDGSGFPTGEWEISECTYSSANTLTRDTVIASSNSDALVNFSAGTKHVYMGADATVLSYVREKLTADRTYYVRTDGSDSNSGLADTSGGAFLTIQKAIDVVADTLDCARKNVYVQVRDGTYTAGVTMRPLVGSTVINIVGNTTTPANCIISTSGSCVNSGVRGFGINISGFKITSSAGIGVQVGIGGYVYQYGAMDIGSCATSHYYCRGAGSYIAITYAYTISGNAPTHMQILDQAGVGFEGIVVTLSGTRAFSSAYIYARSLGFATFGASSFTGSATGKRYDLTLNSACYAGGVTLPGNSAGTTATGGQYA